MKLKKLIFLAIIFIIGSFFIKNGSGFIEGFTNMGKGTKSLYIYNLTDDKEVKSENADKRRPQASLLKIMTVYTALQNISDLSAKAPVDSESYQKLVAENASMAGFSPGENTTFRDLLYGTMLPSGGECANSLAVNIYGNTEGFVRRMNKNASDFNMKDTFYKDVEGLDADGQYTTAHDIGILLKNCLKDGNFRAIFTRENYTSTRTQVHPNGVYMNSTVLGKAKNYRQNGFKIIGGKSGTTYKAGLCWATLVEKKGKEYIVVVMGIPFDDIKNTGDGQITETIKAAEEI